MPNNETPTSESQTYQSMLESVEKIVSDISSEKLELDHVVKEVERGYELIRKMRSRLDETKQKIDHLRLEYEGEQKTSESASN